jgi:hypothetical protein
MKAASFSQKQGYRSTKNSHLLLDYYRGKVAKHDFLPIFRRKCFSFFKMKNITGRKAFCFIPNKVLLYEVVYKLNVFNDE